MPYMVGRLKIPTVSKGITKRDREHVFAMRWVAKHEPPCNKKNILSNCRSAKGAKLILIYFCPLPVVMILFLCRRFWRFCSLLLVDVWVYEIYTRWRPACACVGWLCFPYIAMLRKYGKRLCQILYRAKLLARLQQFPCCELSGFVLFQPVEYINCVTLCFVCSEYAVTGYCVG